MLSAKIKFVLHVQYAVKKFVILVGDYISETTKNQHQLYLMTDMILLKQYAQNIILIPKKFVLIVRTNVSVFTVQIGFTTFRDLLDIELNERIMKKLNQHAVCLNKEKENRLFQFDTHVDQYSRTQLSRLYWK